MTRDLTEFTELYDRLSPEGQRLALRLLLDLWLCARLAGWLADAAEGQHDNQENSRQ